MTALPLLLAAADFYRPKSLCVSSQELAKTGQSLVHCYWTTSIEQRTSPSMWFWTYCLGVLPAAEEATVLLGTLWMLLLECLINLHLHYITVHSNYTYSKLLKYSWMCLMCCPCLKFTTQTHTHTHTVAYQDRTKQEFNYTVTDAVKCYRDRNVYKMIFCGKSSIRMALPEKCTCSPPMTLTFDLLTSRSDQFTSVPNCTNVINLVKFPQAVFMISCSQADFWPYLVSWFLTFDLLNSNTNRFIFIPNCTLAVNLVKFPHEEFSVHRLLAYGHTRTDALHALHTLTN